MGQNSSSSPEEAQKAPVLTGADVLSDDSFKSLRGKRVGLIANSTTALRDWTHLADALARAQGVNLAAIFAPEHGFRGTAQAGSSEKSSVDAATQVPVHDIYRKDPSHLAKIFSAAGVDTLIFDIQDVGVRFYTYIWTLYDCLVGARLSASVNRFLILDRPNPLGGVVVDGPLMQPELASFVGRKAIPLRHGMTVGELGLLFWNDFIPAQSGTRPEGNVHVEVVKLKNWDRDSFPFLQWGGSPFPWIPPSPNMPTPETALVYPGTCLLEGTNCSEGRGTCLPFLLVGATFADSRLAHAMRAECEGPQQHSVLVREANFVPSWGSFQGQQICGIQIHVMDPRKFNPLHFGITLLCSFQRFHRGRFRWRQDGDGTFWVDRLVGTTRVRESIDAGCTADEVSALWHEDPVWFSHLRQKWLLY